MFDGSKLPYEENVRGTCEVVKAAHAMDVDVEAELGRVGIAANKGDFANEDLYTTVDRRLISLIKPSGCAGNCHRQRSRLLCGDPAFSDETIAGN